MPSAVSPVLRRQQRDITVLYATLGDTIESAFARYAPPGQPLTWDARLRVLSEVRAGLDVIFGRFPGDRDAALMRAILRDAADARLRPLDAAVRSWRAELGPALRSRIETEAGEP